ncbi:MAG: S8/S53 family peptidase [Acidobacteriaceae bacterium]|nr:S8/S53 family peptidase [Acidobacteriaceae bacterium]
MLTQRVNENALTALRGNTRPEAKAANDRGPVADDFKLSHMLLQLRRTPEQEKALEQFIVELHDSASPNFQHWISAQEFGQQFGIAQADLDGITNWLRLHGFTIHTIYPNLAVDFSGTAGQVREAFHTQIDHLLVNGERHYANMSDPQIPEAFGALVAGISSLHNFMPHPLSHHVRNHPIPGFTIGPHVEAVVPQDIATIYNLSTAFNNGLSGRKQTIAVLEDSDLFSTDDWLTFRQSFGLAQKHPKGTLVTIHPDVGGTCFDPGITGDDAEATIDAELATASAPSAIIEVASCASTINFGAFIALQNMLTNGSTPPEIVSFSFGQPEVLLGAAYNAYIESLYQLAVAEGVSIFVGSGDSGAAFEDMGLAGAISGITVSGYASTPYNVAVGATDFADTYLGETNRYWNPHNSKRFGSARSYIPEIPWNDSCASELLAHFNGFATTHGATGFCNNGGPNTTFAGSGGPSGCATGDPTPFGTVGNTCAGYPKPQWQNVLGNPQDGVRDIPDISLFASNGIWGHYSIVCFSDVFNGGTPCTGDPSTWSGFGGTSLSTPLMAGIQALVNEATGKRWGNPNPVYYKLANLQLGANGRRSCEPGDDHGEDDHHTDGHRKCTFHDITMGDIAVNCSGPYNCYDSAPGLWGVLSSSQTSFEPAYAAGKGWDFATGLGSVDVWNLIKNWCSAAGRCDEDRDDQDDHKGQDK